MPAFFLWVGEGQRGGEGLFSSRLLQLIKKKTSLVPLGSSDSRLMLRRGEKSGLKVQGSKGLGAALSPDMRTTEA
jgi:hypothetical protein